MPTQDVAIPRNTRQKEAIRDAFQAAGRPLHPEEAWDIAKADVKALSLATVYRNVRALLADKWLVPIEIPGQATRYERAGKAHHHHFHCTICGKLFELDGCNVQVKTKVPRGFRATGHEFFVYGSCSECR